MKSNQHHPKGHSLRDRNSVFYSTDPQYLGPDGTDLRAAEPREGLIQLVAFDRNQSGPRPFERWMTTTQNQSDLSEIGHIKEGGRHQ